MKYRPPRPRKIPSRNTIPPEVSEVTGNAPQAVSEGEAVSDPIPEHIRKMLEAAYT